ncbi:MAG: hypothetical protein LBB75_04575, partial [Oscillospiraceae bacterium]|nr:hypothetical protein [Oscillospiraceae bacterium]
RDVADIAVARLIAGWFRRLHSRGREYGGLAQLDLLDRVEEELCMKNIAATMRKSNSRENPFWASLIHHLDGIKSAYPRLCDTITYNDFWWDNMALAIDGSSAIMFDYNCMYRKYAYADLRHILSVLTEEAGGAFLDAYGAYSAEEKAFEDMFFPLTGLIAAYRMKAFPAWAGEFKDMLLGGELMKRLGILEKFL